MKLIKLEKLVKPIGFSPYGFNLKKSNKYSLHLTSKRYTEIRALKSRIINYISGLGAYLSLKI